MMLDTILKGDQQMTIPSNFELIWLSGFKGDDLNVSILLIPFQNCVQHHSRWLPLLKIEIS
jgi:hypothetical protein